MNRCDNQDIGRMLHAWELGMLSEDQRQQFELHLLQCESCAEEAGQFLRAGHLLRHDSDLKPTADELSVTNALYRAGPRIFSRKSTRVLLMAAVILAVAIPVYRMTFAPRDRSAPVQQLQLVPVRGGSENTIRHDLRGTVEIHFYVEGAGPGSDCRVVVASDNGNVVYSNEHFTTFAETGSGTIVLPVTIFDVGLYELTVKAVGDSSSMSLQTYHFRVE